MQKLIASGICDRNDVCKTLDALLHKVPVVTLGYQDWDDGTSKLLVNDMSGSTHVFDPEKHLLCKAVKS